MPTTSCLQHLEQLLSIVTPASHQDLLQIAGYVSWLCWAMGWPQFLASHIKQCSTYWLQVLMQHQVLQQPRKLRPPTRSRTVYMDATPTYLAARTHTHTHNQHENKIIFEILTVMDTKICVVGCYITQSYRKLAMFQGSRPLPVFRAEKISILKMVAASSSKTLVTFYQTAQWHILERIQQPSKLNEPNIVQYRSPIQNVFQSHQVTLSIQYTDMDIQGLHFMSKKLHPLRSDGNHINSTPWVTIYTTHYARRLNYWAASVMP
jgi:hypothetical protein